MNEEAEGIVVDDQLGELVLAAKRAKKSVKKIDRAQENERVLRFQRTGEEDVLNAVYLERIPTIEHLAGQYAWITEDMASELRLVFMKSVRKYTGGKADFNTFFYTSVLNRMRNMIKRKYRKKRTVEGNPSMINIFLNLDDRVPTGEGLTYHEVIPDDSYDVAKEIRYAELVKAVADGNKIVEDLLFLVTYSRRSEFTGKCHRLMYSCPNSGADPVEAIHADIGLPNKLYELLDYDHDEESVIYEIAVCGRLAFSHIARITSRRLGAELY